MQFYKRIIQSMVKDKSAVCCAKEHSGIWWHVRDSKIIVFGKIEGNKKGQWIVGPGTGDCSRVL